LRACKKPSTGPVSPPPVSPPPVSPPPPTCEIYEFSINDKTNEDKDPLLVWVNASLRGLISTNTDCTKCTVESTDTWGNPPKEYAINEILQILMILMKILFLLKQFKLLIFHGGERLCLYCLGF